MLKVGDRIKDNDPRVGKRVLTITGIGFGKDGPSVTATDGYRTVSIRQDRIYTDGKPRRSGFSMI